MVAVPVLIVVLFIGVVVDGSGVVVAGASLVVGVGVMFVVRGLRITSCAALFVFVLCCVSGDGFQLNRPSKVCFLLLFSGAKWRKFGRRQLQQSIITTAVLSLLRFFF